MPSDLIVDICSIKEVKNHPNADKLDLAIIKGWQVCVPKGQYKEGDIVVYCPPDAMLPLELADKLGVAHYLSTKKDATEGRVRAIRLRSEMSYGFIFDTKLVGLEGDLESRIGENIAESLGITKYEPPVKLRAGDAESDHILFHKYTDIQNWRNFPDIIQEGKEVVMTEKIHGTNVRVGIVFTGDSNERNKIESDEWVKKNFEFMIGSHNSRKKFSMGSIYEIPLKENVKKFLMEFVKTHEVKSVILFGEIFGAGIQDLKYGKQKEPDFRAFDIFVDGNPLDYDDFVSHCTDYGVEVVPLLYRGPFSKEEMMKASQGKTILMEKDAHMREGTVIRLVKEERDPVFGRIILKMINDEYLLRKSGTENH